MISLNIENIRKELPPQVKLVAVSKFHPVESLLEAMEAGQRCFAESRPQEFAAKFRRRTGKSPSEYRENLPANYF